MGALVSVALVVLLAAPLLAASPAERDPRARAAEEALRAAPPPDAVESGNDALVPEAADDGVEPDGLEAEELDDPVVPAPLARGVADTPEDLEAPPAASRPAGPLVPGRADPAGPAQPAGPIE